MPETITPQRLQVLRAAFDAALMPADPRAFAVQIDRLFAKARLWRIDLPQQERDRTGKPIGPDPVAEMAEGYRRDLGHLPADLLEQAVTWACQHWRNSFRLPMAGDLLETVSAILAQRKRDRMKLDVVGLKVSHRPPRDRSNPADQAAAAAAFEAMRAALAKSAVRVMERKADDDLVPADPHAAAARGRAMLTGLTLDQRIERARR